MERRTMLEELTEREEELREELIGLEKDFSAKKEQYFKIQGAIEAITLLEGESAAEEE